MAWGDDVQTVSVAIATGTTGDVTIFDTPSRDRFACFGIYVMNSSVSNSFMIFKSGSTEISGTMTLLNVTTEGGPSTLQVFNFGNPILVGLDQGDDFVINKTGSGTISGWALVGRASGTGV